MYLQETPSKRGCNLTCLIKLNTSNYVRKSMHGRRVPCSAEVVIGKTPIHLGHRAQGPENDVFHWNVKLELEKKSTPFLHALVAVIRRSGKRRDTTQHS
ncbi:hypothetical protein PoB_001254800 [Plakobranchus ocellatus]|uniref:Uncharacterized protein n=1 Tax=Plakobranchus ocellatus TaxID=259542 RepID=A0AAV3YU14_9GAST|nr:hypothetical protein PoB_001254800 [Plakobranchus ocellatus]